MSREVKGARGDFSNAYVPKDSDSSCSDLEAKELFTALSKYYRVSCKEKYDIR